MSPCSETWDCADSHGAPVPPIPPPLSPCGCEMIRFYYSLNSPMADVGTDSHLEGSDHPIGGSGTNYSLTQTSQSPFSLTQALATSDSGLFGKWVSPPLVARPDVDGLTPLSSCTQYEILYGFGDRDIPQPGPSLTIAYGGDGLWYIWRPSTGEMVWQGFPFSTSPVYDAVIDEAASAVFWGSTAGSSPGTADAAFYTLHSGIRIPIEDGDVWVVEVFTTGQEGASGANITFTGGYIEFPACIMDPSIIAG